MEYIIIEIFDSGYERIVGRFDTMEAARDYCEEIGWRTSNNSYLTIDEY